MTNLTAGKRLYSEITATEVMVVKGADGILTCAGAPMIAARTAPVGADAEADVFLGKRYVDEASGLIVLCTRAGQGPLAFEGRTLGQQATAALPSSD